MQSEWPEGPGPIEPYDPNILEERLKKGATAVKVFKEHSSAHKQALVNWNRLSPNQKRRIRRRLAG